MGLTRLVSIHRAIFRVSVFVYLHILYLQPDWLEVGGSEEPDRRDGLHPLVWPGQDPLPQGPLAVFQGEAQAPRSITVFWRLFRHPSQ